MLTLVTNNNACVYLSTAIYAKSYINKTMS